MSLWDVRSCRSKGYLGLVHLGAANSTTTAVHADAGARIAHRTVQNEISPVISYFF